MYPILSLPPRRLATLILLPCLVIFPVWLVGRLVVSMKAEAPVREAQALKSALDHARRARAREYAAPDLKIAEAAAEQAIAEYHRTVSEKTGFLRYDIVRRHLFGAHEKATFAWSRARQRAGASRDNAQRLINDGVRGVAAAQAALADAPIGAAVRANLARARVAVATAALRLTHGDYEAAAREATIAKTTSDDIRHRARTFVETYSTGETAQKWGHWVRQTIDVSRRTGAHAVVVDKLKHKCYLYRGGSLVRVYTAEMGGPIQDKLRAGDRATPEGMYRVIQKKGPGQTAYYKALLINYPNEEDRADFNRAKKQGWVSRYARIGGLIEIHGGGGRREDWTLGCVALTNGDMDELFRLVGVGTPVTIVGTVAS